MSKTYSLVALLDVLAYRNHLKADRSAGTEEFKAKLEKALSVLASINETELSYQAISDTIIIAANPSSMLSDFLVNHSVSAASISGKRSSHSWWHRFRAAFQIGTCDI